MADAVNGKGSGPATMRDVAREAEVSVQTVSNFVNERFEAMGEKTRERVGVAMEKLGYFPNLTARGLRSSRTSTLAFLVIDEHARFLADPLTDLLLAGVGDVARDRSYGILVQSARPGDDPTSLLRPILESRVDGAFLLMSGKLALRRSYVERLKATNRPFVVFDETTSDSEVLSVRAHERRGGRLMTEHLLEKGHRRIAFIAAAVPFPVIEQRHRGYREALKQAGIEPVRELQLFEGGWDPSEAVTMTTRLLGLTDPPTAIICGSDLLAGAAIHAAVQTGRSVPDDLAVCGFDDFPFAAYLNPPLTTVEIPAFEMGSAAATILTDLLDGKRPARPHVILDVRLRVRESG